jgi:LPXTG-site transpeptidase (sortase) family protein
VLKEKSKKREISTKLKPLSTLSAVVLAILVLIAVDFGDQFIKNESINPPEADIVHSEDPGQITEFNLKIEKLEIDVTIIPNVDGKEKSIYNDALNNGVAHYKNTALPNSGSNIVIFGHSSTVLGIGKYAKVFATLNKLDNGDEIKIIFNKNEYKYLVSEKKVIAPDDFSVVMPTKREELTLLTCWPIGTSEKRLAIIAKPEQP